MIRWAHHAFSISGVSTVMLFVDILSAFYAMIREIVFPLLTSDEDLDMIIDRNGVPQPFVGPPFAAFKGACHA